MLILVSACPAPAAFMSDVRDREKSAKQAELYASGMWRFAGAAAKPPAGCHGAVCSDRRAAMRTRLPLRLLTRLPLRLCAVQRGGPSRSCSSSRRTSRAGGRAACGRKERRGRGIGFRPASTAQSNPIDGCHTVDGCHTAVPGTMAQLIVGMGTATEMADQWNREQAIAVHSTRR